LFNLKFYETLFTCTAFAIAKVDQLIGISVLDTRPSSTGNSSFGNFAKDDKKRKRSILDSTSSDPPSKRGKKRNWRLFCEVKIVRKDIMGSILCNYATIVYNYDIIME